MLIMTDKIDKNTLPEISPEEVFPHNRVEQCFVNKPDGMYVVKQEWTSLKHIAHIKDGKFVQYDYYNIDSTSDLKPEFIHLIWTFDYDEKQSIYREFPKLGIPKRIFYDKENGRYDKEEQEKFKNTWNKMLAEVLNESMQLNDNVEKVTNCDKCGNTIVHRKDGGQICY